MEQKIELILDQCIDEMRKGKNIEECVARFPEYADQLMPLLQLAWQIEELPSPNPSQEAVSATLINIGRKIAQDTTGREVTVVFPKVLKKTPMLNVFRWPKLALAGAAIFVVVLFSAATISTDSIPGDILYPLKLVTEKVKFSLTFDAGKKAELRLTFSDERLNELVEVFQQSNKLDTTLLKNMLDEAKLALEENGIPVEKTSILTAKLNHISAYQKNVLESIRPDVQSSDRKIVDEAINMCDMRSHWMRRMMNEEYQEQDTTRKSQTPNRKRHQPERMQWGPGCDWMR